MPTPTKIKVFISPRVRSQLEMDVLDYSLRGIGTLCNRILENIPEFPKSVGTTESDEPYKNSPPLQFSLHKKNEGIVHYVQSSKMKLAALCRHCFEEYVNLPRGKRECFLQREFLQKINEAIQAQENLFLNYRGDVRHISPCFVAFSPSGVRAYLVVCEDPADSREPFHAFRLSQIQECSPDPKSEAFHKKSFALSHQADLFKAHFDPFLCYGKEVAVRLNGRGVQKLQTAVTNRPKFDPAKVQDGIYRFECSEKLAQIYFPQFLEDAEILSPPTLRDWFRERFQAAASLYKK